MNAVQWVVIGWGAATVLLAVVWVGAVRAFRRLGDPQPPIRLHVVRTDTEGGRR